LTNQFMWGYKLLELPSLEASGVHTVFSALVSSRHSSFIFLRIAMIWLSEYRDIFIKNPFGSVYENPLLLTSTNFREDYSLTLSSKVFDHD